MACTSSLPLTDLSMYPSAPVLMAEVTRSLSSDSETAMILVGEPDPFIASMTLKASTVFLRSRNRMSGQSSDANPDRVAQDFRFADDLNIPLLRQVQCDAPPEEGITFDNSNTYLVTQCRLRRNGSRQLPAERANGDDDGICDGWILGRNRCRSATVSPTAPKAQKVQMVANHEHSSVTPSHAR